jgi:hypothetical protein
MPLLHKSHDRFLSDKQPVHYVIRLPARRVPHRAAAYVLDRVAVVSGDVATDSSIRFSWFSWIEVTRSVDMLIC